MFTATSLILLLLPLTLVSHKIAIVGGGIGGATNAHFLKQLLGESADIKIFERAQVGGRLSEIVVGGKSYDSGGSIIHSENEYAKALTKLVGLKVEKLSGSSGVGLYDGSQYVLKLSGSFSDKLKIVGRYGFEVKKLLSSSEKMINDLKRIYCLQSNKVAFKSLSDLMNSTHPELLTNTQQTMSEYLTKLGISELLQNEMVTASIHANYNQELDVHAFVGSVSLAGGMVGSLWKVKDGNFQLPEKVIQHNAVNLVKGSVTSILKSGARFSVSYSSSAGVEAAVETEEFDAVVLATPLHNADLILPSDVTVVPQEFQRTVATFVNGDLAPLVPGVENPGDILTVVSKEELIFSSIGFKGKGEPGKNYKIFSKKPLSDSEIKKLFRKVNEMKVVDWNAYPKYSARKTLPDFELMPGLYHINAVEAAASAIEMSCIGSQNVALLVFQYLENVENINPDNVCRKDDMKKYKLEL